ncbi:hypothetical protein [Lacinutrix sp. Bg11-31]|uniref:hypothetical protein n=1 Tax=Lacinutrix sp. Bg11-31 TaxID=2057808 RepID=UPI0012FDB6CB|nr:hypothetical protein [Lacinutrix sp. Bg11-31]
MDCFFLSIVQFSGNITGITYNNDTDLLLSNMGWFPNNLGTYETFTNLEKQGGFSEVNGSTIGLDVSSNPVEENEVFSNVSFRGTSTQYVKKYTTGSFAGCSFNNTWTVDYPRIPIDSDEVATGHIYYDGTITTGFVQSVLSGSPYNLSVNLLRVSSPQDNRITYLGKKTKTFQASASLSVTSNVNLGDYYAFFIGKNGTTTLT